MRVSEKFYFFTDKTVAMTASSTGDFSTAFDSVDVFRDGTAKYPQQVVVSPMTNTTYYVVAAAECCYVCEAITVVANMGADLDPVADVTGCAGEAVTMTFSSTTPGAKFFFECLSNNGTGIPAHGTTSASHSFMGDQCDLCCHW